MDELPPRHPSFPHWCMADHRCCLVYGHHEPCVLVADIEGEDDNCGRCGRCCPDLPQTNRQKIAAVQRLIDQAQAVSPSDRMTVYVGDLQQALGQRDERARTRTGADQ